MRRTVLLIGILLAASVLLLGGCQTDAPAAAPDDHAAATDDVYLPEVARITVPELKSRVDGGARIAIVDSRSHDEYDELHIDGAISMPLSGMGGIFPELEGYDEIVTYCT